MSVTNKSATLLINRGRSLQVSHRVRLGLPYLIIFTLLFTLTGKSEMGIMLLLVACAFVVYLVQYVLRCGLICFVLTKKSLFGRCACKT